MATLWTEILVRPIFNLLVGIYSFLPIQDLGIAILILTVLIRLALYPLNRKSIIQQRALQKIQPKVEELKEKHKDDREKLGQEMMAMYKREGVNPFSSCLPLIIQLPILFAVFQVFLIGLNDQSFELLYTFIPNPGVLNPIAFGFLNLVERSIPIAVLAGIAQFWQSRMLMNRREQAGSMANAMNKQMLYVFPIITVVIGSSFPAGLALYWFATTLLSGLQQVVMIRRKEISVDSKEKKTE